MATRTEIERMAKSFADSSSVVQKNFFVAVTEIANKWIDTGFEPGFSPGELARHQWTMIGEEIAKEGNEHVKAMLRTIVANFDK